MLLFFCAAGHDLDDLRRAGVRAATLRASLAEAQAACAGPLLVVEEATLDGTDVPPGAFLNLDPYLPPEPVVAGGGYVMRAGADGPEVLLIFRRGVWDLPKGKQDPGETVEACARREVSEEIGVARLDVGAPLGTTQHGYAEKGRYRVKTTHWFLMQTPAMRFAPEEREGIEVVAWTPWEEALGKIGFETLRRHMRQIEPQVFEALREG